MGRVKDYYIQQIENQTDWDEQDQWDEYLEACSKEEMSDEIEVESE